MYPVVVEDRFFSLFLEVWKNRVTMCHHCPFLHFGIYRKGVVSR